MTFHLTSEKLDTAGLKESLEDARAGALTVFEGIVRNHNDGRAVNGLEYEAYESLALKEGERILAEAKQRFNIYNSSCTHRVGFLNIGETAVWVGVAAAHRDEAFTACRYIIDEIKHRLPIWKKEHYQDGRTGWVNCQHSSQPQPQLRANEHSYAQQANHSLHCAPDETRSTTANFATKTVSLMTTDHDWELDPLDLSGADFADFEIVDIREPGEPPANHLWSLLRCSVRSHPLSVFDPRTPDLKAGNKFLFVCQKGASSAHLVEELRSQGYKNTFSLAGGIEALRRKFLA